jgi:glyoxylase-like metal-dependent hydrolase (beta-lactamase superfamily II)
MLRILLTALLPLAAASCAPTTPPAEAVAPATSAAQGGVTFSRLAAGVWLHTEYRAVPGFGNVISHGLVVEHGRSTVLIDTGWNDAQTRAILQWAQHRLHRPVTAAIVTHAHDDKMGGMAALHEAGVQTFAARLTNEDAPARGLIPAQVALDFDSHGRLTPASARSTAALAGLEPFYPGAGHTRDNIVVGVAGGSIVFGGCLIRPPGATDMGNTSDGDLAHWAVAVDAAAAAFPRAGVIVPSHGPPAGRALFALTARLARAARDGG